VPMRIRSLEKQPNLPPRERDAMPKKNVVSIVKVQKRILMLRGQRVILDQDLAQLYGVETKTLKRAVRRNLERFPLDFMFCLTVEESSRLRYQFGTLERGQHSKYLPYAFSEEGVAMLSSVLRSQQAIKVNIAIMRAFVRLREILAAHKNLVHKLEELERKYETHDLKIRTIFEAIRQLMEPERSSDRRIGFDVRDA
jgi:hypothetical protein